VRADGVRGGVSHCGLGICMQGEGGSPTPGVGRYSDRIDQGFVG
jgi:hypothetical protein